MVSLISRQGRTSLYQEQCSHASVHNEDHQLRDDRVGPLEASSRLVKKPAETRSDDDVTSCGKSVDGDRERLPWLSDEYASEGWVITYIDLQ